ncbi:MAG TPA: GNAT family N-acetyltransferase [Bacillota bacterium]|nr:GNAT family N-acetyltransferase [Bacillota bacterium]
MNQDRQEGKDALKNHTALTLRKAGEADLAYIKDLAQREIGRIPRRLHSHQNYLVYLQQKRIGFISYCRLNEEKLYIYMMALEEQAQNHGLARHIVKWVLAREVKISPVQGILFRVYKTNSQALHATLEKYNYKIIKELPQHYVLYRALDPQKDPVNKAGQHE